MKLKFNMEAFEKLGKKKRFSLKKKLALGVAALGLVAALAACAGVNDSPAPKDLPEAPEQTSEMSTPEQAPTEESTFQLLADRLNISNLTINDKLTPRIEAEAEAALEALTPNGQTTYKPSDVFIAPDGTAWVSKEDYINNTQSSETTVDVAPGQYVDSEGNVWESEEAYLEYIKGQNNETGQSQVEGDYYIAPDGTAWSNEEEYNKYIVSQNGQVTPDDGTGEVVEQGEGYKAPDGSYWSSEEDYLEYIAAEQQNNANETVIPPSDTTTEVEDNSYYEAPDGTWWSSEEDYLAFSSSNSVGTSAPTEETTTVEVVPESDYTETTDEVQTPDMSGYYQDPEGNWWASEEDYLAYLASLEATTEKTR